MNTEKALYRKTQSGTLIVVTLLFGILWVLGIGFKVGWHPVTLFVGVLLCIALILFRSLTIELNYSELRCYFGDGLISRRFPLSEIVSASPVRNRWYYGWGIRLTPSGWMFNVSGLEAVELTFVSGKRFRIGTDNPQEVVEAINQLKR